MLGAMQCGYGYLSAFYISLCTPLLLWFLSTLKQATALVAGHYPGSTWSWDTICYKHVYLHAKVCQEVANCVAKGGSNSGSNNWLHTSSR